MFSSDLAPTKQKNQQPCPVCGAQDYEWGYMTSTGYQSGDQYSMWRTKRAVQVMKVRRCKACDNVQQFFDEDATKKVMRTTWVIVGLVFVMIFLFFVIPLVLMPIG